MKRYEVFTATENGWSYYGKTPILAQALAVKVHLNERGITVRIKEYTVRKRSEVMTGCYTYPVNN